MGLYALVSAGGSPGVTTAALALALSWPAPVTLAECDPGGGDILPGLFAGHLPATVGLLNLAFEAGRGPAEAARELGRQLIPLDESGTRTLLAGLTDPRQALLLAPSWQPVATALAAHQDDVIADCGRLDAGESQPLAVLAQASKILLVLRPSLRQAASARSRVDLLGQLLGGTSRLALLVTGKGRHDAKELAVALGVPAAGRLPHDQVSARVLSDGEGRRKDLGGRPLLRAARGIAAGMRGPAAAGPVAAPEPAPATAGPAGPGSGGPR